ncbi:hypothetical protein CFP56_019541 [Quercus suber]|uniref:Uncharacterized protein n=1 Tax=Quercus suber TaxID=58331 RepID=A0AAW0KJ90_QUESU
MLKPSGEELHRRSSLGSLEPELHFKKQVLSYSFRCPKPSIFHFAFTLFHLLAPFKFPLQPLKFKPRPPSCKTLFFFIST